VDKKLTFVRIPKNASTTIYKHIAQINTIKDDVMPSLEEHFGVFASSHCRLSEAVKELGEGILDKIVFSVCRNPYDRAISMFHFANDTKFIGRLFAKHMGSRQDCKKLGAFDEFVDWLCSVPSIASHSQSYYLDVDTDIDVLRFESLNRDWFNFIQKHRLVINYKIGHSNQTKFRGVIDDYYDDSIKKKIAELWSEDFERFNYEI
jgi:hypothetical protein